MHGNVWEWCWDRYGPYGSDPVTNPIGPKNGVYRVLRGGSFNYVIPQDLRSANRVRYSPEFRDFFTGFRVARTP